MGLYIGYKCPNCTYRLDISLGEGFMFPKVYAETRERCLNGEFGDYIKEFLEAFPEGEIDAESVAVQCQNCENIFVVQELAMYLPGENYINWKPNKQWCVEFSFKDVRYFTHFDLVKYFDLFDKYEHKCARCNGTCNIIARDALQIKDPLCPDCHIKLEFTDFEQWD